MSNATIRWCKIIWLHQKKFETRLIILLREDNTPIPKQHCFRCVLLCVPVAWGRERKPVESCCTSARASRSAETPWEQSRGAASWQTFRRWHIPPKGGHEIAACRHPPSAWVSEATSADATQTHLHHLRVVEPLAENGLDESKHLLQNHHHLKTHTGPLCLEKERVRRSGKKKD